MSKAIHQTHNIKPQNPLRNGKNLIRKQNLSMFLPLIVLALLTTISFFSLSSPNSSADSGASVDAGVSVALACTLSGSETTHAVTVNNNSFNDNISGTTLHTVCNGSGDYNIYAIGYTNNTDGNNVLDGGTSGTIPTGTTLNGKVSNWAMKLAYTSGSGDDKVIQNNYDTFQIIPSTSTLVASYNATSNQTTDSTLQTTYGVSISPNQPAGTYTGQVKYTMTHGEYKPPYMQTATASELATLMPNIGDTAVLYDNRDGQFYTIGKLADGRYWMLENLRLGAVALISPMSAQNTNMSPDSDFTIPTETASYDSSTAISQPMINVDYYNSKSTGGEHQGKVGVYYNYCAVTAGTVCTSFYFNDAEYDICPSGWHLPSLSSSDRTKDYNVLYSSYDNDYLAMKSALRLILSSRITSDALDGSSSPIWSASIGSPYNTSAILAEGDSSAMSTSYAGRYWRIPARCVRTS